MPDFSYTALAPTGKRDQGTLTANSEREVMAVLDSRGLFPVSIELTKTSVVRGGSNSGRVKSRYMAAFFAQLADLLRAGVSLLRALQILEKQSSNPTLSGILREIHVKVADGTSLADSMAVHPSAFNDLAVSMVRAGEEGGFIEDVLERIAVFTEHQEDLKAKVIGALAYPIFLAITGLVVLNVLVMFFVPRFEPIFKKLDEKGELPWLTQFLIKMSHFMLGYWWVVVIGTVAGFFLFRNWSRTEAGRTMLDGWRLKMPSAGTIYLNLALSRFTRILGTLLRNGIPILQALRIAKDSTGNRVLSAAIDQAAENVTAGNSLAQPLAACQYFPRDVVEMVAVGEESNHLEKVLLDIADGLEKRTSRQLELFVRLLEPVMLLVMAGVTLLVVAGLLLPVFKMSSARTIIEDREDEAPAEPEAAESTGSAGASPSHDLARDDSQDHGGDDMFSRRQFLQSAGGGFGMLALQAMLAEQGLLADEPSVVNPLAPRRPHHSAKAKSVIFLFMSGGPSHLETFDPKPDLQRLQGQPLPASFGPVVTRRAVDRNRLLGTWTTFRKYGQAGIEVSNLLPHTASRIDDLCVLRGCYGVSVTHPESVYLMNTGSILMGRPSLGSWVAYGLGTENQNMPAFVVMPDPAGWVKGGAPAWGNGYLPSAYQGTLITGGRTPIRHLANPQGVTGPQQRRTLDLVNRLNREHQLTRPEDSDLAARIAAYELAYRMQEHSPEVVDLASETQATKRLYGIDQSTTSEFGTRCLLARRMVERGVRFVQLYCGDTNGWDAHTDIVGNHTRLCVESDLPVAGLLHDLKSRGLLESTLVVWGGEFGRTPMTEGTTGRDHNPYGFSMWLAGGGVKGGQVIGSTDAVGLRAAEDKTHVHDIHATILHLLGINHRRLTYRHNGRNERLTENAGEVIEQAIE